MVSLLLTSAALLCWPGSPAPARLRVLAGHAPRKRLRTPNKTTMTSSAALIAAWLLAGVGGAVAAAMLTATIRRQLKARAETQRSLAMTDGLTEALRTLVTGLRAGAHPATAAESAAADAHPGTAATMHAVAMAARLDGDLTAVVDTARSPDVRATLSRLATAWQLAQRHGLPLADVLDAVRRDLEQRARFTRHVLARMAGPRSSALALSLLPALGLALGTAMGANPLAMLTDTVPGQALLVAGVALMCAGIAWSTRITTRAVPR